MFELNRDEINTVSGGLMMAPGEHPFIAGFESAMIGLSEVGFGLMGGIAGSAVGPGGTVFGAAIGTAVGSGLANAAVDNLNGMLGLN